MRSPSGANFLHSGARQRLLDLDCRVGAAVGRLGAVVLCYVAIEDHVRRLVHHMTPLARRVERLGDRSGVNGRALGAASSSVRGSGWAPSGPASRPGSAELPGGGVGAELGPCQGWHIAHAGERARTSCCRCEAASGSRHSSERCTCTCRRHPVSSPGRTTSPARRVLLAARPRQRRVTRPRRRRWAGSPTWGARRRVPLTVTRVLR